MKIRKCDLCKCDISNESGASFKIVGIGDYDFCDECIKIVRKAVCKKCHGEGTVREVDDEASCAQATCGENRTQYRTVKCKCC